MAGMETGTLSVAPSAHTSTLALPTDTASMLAVEPPLPRRLRTVVSETLQITLSGSTRPDASVAMT
jgi:hypothetical protein